MKLFSCFFICVQFLFLDSASAAKFRENDSNNSGILGGNVREKGTHSSAAMLLSDGNAKGTKYGERDVLLSGYGPINLTLTSTSRELEFEVCNCAGTSSVCYKSLDGWGNSIRAGSCSDSTSCELKVHDDEDGIYFGKSQITKTSIAGCLRTSMKYPDAKVKDAEGNVDVPFQSCSPKMVDKIVELYISIDASCSIIVKNAKVRVPITPPSTTNLTTKVPPEHSPEHPSEASFPWWGFLIIGIALLIVVAVIGFIIYRLYRNRQTSKGAPQKADEIKPRATVSKAGNADVETPTKKHDNLEAVKVVPIQKSKKVEAVKVVPIRKSKKVEAVKVEAENVTKEVLPKKVPPKKQAPIEPTLDDPTTGASVTATENQQPHVSVPKNVIHPAPLQPASKGITQYSKSSSRKGSLSGRHEIGMQLMVEKPSETVKRRSPDSIDDATKDKLERFYPSDSARPRPLEKREIMLFCCTKISVMFKSIELLVDIAIEKLAEHGAKFGDNETVVELSAEAERYVQSSTTLEYVRSFAFGGIFRELIDSQAEADELCPIPLLFIIVLQRRYSVRNRRQACTWIRRQMPIVFAEFSLKEKKTLPYPITAIEDAYKMDPDGFKNIAALFTESGMEEEPTQDSVTRASKKNRKKESGGGKKKRSKKRR